MLQLGNARKLMQACKVFYKCSCWFSLRALGNTEIPNRVSTITAVVAKLGSAARPIRSVIRVVLLMPVASGWQLHGPFD